MANKRSYKMAARAVAASETRERVLDAAVECFGSHAYDAVSLKAIAKQAGVGLQTVIRVRSSKEELFLAAAERITAGLVAELTSAPQPTDPSSALSLLMGAYELWGDRAMRLVAQEERVPAIKSFADHNRTVQRNWIKQLYAKQLEPLDAATRRRSIAAALTAAGLRSWYVLRRVHGLSQQQTTLAVSELLSGAIGPTTP